MANELYTQIGVQLEATSEEIRKAYFIAVRKNPPEKEPEKFKLIQEAYNILKNDKSRKDYDAQQKHGGEIARLEAEAIACAEKGNYVEVIQLYKRTLVLYPDNTAIMAKLARALENNKEPINALPVYEKLFGLDSKNVQYFIDACFTCATVYKTNKDNLYLQKIKKNAEKALEIESNNPGAYFIIGLSYYYEKNLVKALQYIDIAITVNDDIDYQSAIFFQMKMKLCIEDKNISELKSLQQQIVEKVLDQDLKNYIGKKLCEIYFPLMEKLVENYQVLLTDSEDWFSFAIEFLQFISEKTNDELSVKSSEIKVFFESVINQYEKNKNNPPAATSTSSSSSCGNSGSGCALLLAALIPLGMCFVSICYFMVN